MGEELEADRSRCCQEGPGWYFEDLVVCDVYILDMFFLELRIPPVLLALIAGGLMAGLSLVVPAASLPVPWRVPISIDGFQVRPEEWSLGRLFGTEFDSYAKSVRRWIWQPGASYRSLRAANGRDRHQRDGACSRLSVGCETGSKVLK